MKQVLAFRDEKILGNFCVWCLDGKEKDLKNSINSLKRVLTKKDPGVFRELLKKEDQFI